MLDSFREFDRLAQSVFGPGFGVGFRLHPERPGFGALDAYSRDGKVYVHMDLPGVDPDAIEVTLDEGWLQVSVERKNVLAPDTRQFVSERTFGSFTRRLYMGDGVDAEAVEAGYDFGVLTVVAPLASKASSKKIRVASSVDLTSPAADGSGEESSESPEN